MDVDPVQETGDFFGDEPKSKPDVPAASSATPPLTLKMPPTALKMPPALGRLQRTERIEGADKRTELSRSEDRDPRLSVMGNRLEMPSPPTGPRPQVRSETVPAMMNDSGPIMLAPAQLRALLEDGPADQVLLLDIRSSQTFSQSHVVNALNLCVPTTLLKRASYNLEKLQQNFSNPVDKERFSRWNEFDHLVVYDSHSTDKKDAAAAVNMVKKFTNEGYRGQTFILRGGFNVFQEAYPELVELPEADMLADAGGAAASSMAPVIGGVMLPASTTVNASNPFFGNIRQNMDLADGVGQLEISRPAGLDSWALPQWLRTAVAQPDHGKMVADKFLKIEREEQSRMQRVYTSFGAANTQQPSVQISGIEQGVKNRYKDILPFEHTRVKLQGRPSGACDYVNASHIRASRSNKRYIATQGPLPATFDDFWSIVWDQDVRVIVMLTAESEGGQLKCHSYWKSSDYGPIRLRLLSEKKVSLDVDRHRPDSTSSSAAQPEPFGRRRANTTTSLDAADHSSGNVPAQSDSSHYVIVRKFALSHATHPFSPMREITHLHYPSWPDFGAPARPSHLLALVELTNVTQRFSTGMDAPSMTNASSPTAKRDASEMTSVPSLLSQPSWTEEPERDARVRPVLVHCSAGCGRTGTFCAVDSVIDMLKRQRNAAGGAHNATATATATSAPNKDAQGDVIMGDAGHVHASPIATSAPGGFFSASPTEARRSSNASITSPGGRVSDAAPLDTSWLNDTSLDLIQQTVEDFRRQRISMVQSLRQFVLCYETVTEWTWRFQERGPGGGIIRSATADNGVLAKGAGGRSMSRARSGSLGFGRAVDG
jgi:protein tyrosine phosphatase/rhodanese-related sulfurtransferase